MKIFLICFDNETISYPKAFMNRGLAEKRLYEMQYEMDAKDGVDSKSHWYSVEEMEVEFEAIPMTLEEVFNL